MTATDVACLRALIFEVIDACCFDDHFSLCVFGKVSWRHDKIHTEVSHNCQASRLQQTVWS
jgi:hypothetical protein